ncbi:putative BPI/LBP family protein At1g04970 [Cucurbita maxima]|uniref:BPI/LBP family protein At1g04970 n=1 Tax=Cucurbita maxima TaxID=3661 RepID=A0A6J1J767_CUCMA|nr:putative BPI/LBP family protein At1g04970 [Cucurbita maxima]
MSPMLFLLLLVSSLIPGYAHPSPTQSFMSAVISQKGIDFLKDLLIDKAISSVVPINLPESEKKVKIPFVGNVLMRLSNTTIYRVDVPSSDIKPGESGVSIIASGTTCDLSMDWLYSYSTWLVPAEISDKGRASVQVDGMEVRLNLGLELQEETLKLFLLECGCSVQDMSIKLDGGASWLYQGLVDAFEEQISSAVEKAICKKLGEGILKVDSFLQTLPKEVKVNDNASFDTTLAGEPLLSSSSFGIKINGLFRAGEKLPMPEYHFENSPSPSPSCKDPSKMFGITLDEAVFNSALALYYDADFMQWSLKEVPNQPLLNTAGWRFIVPQLYKKYPNADMSLNITLPSPPVIRISEHPIFATVDVDIIVDVVEAGELIPVACISLLVHASSTAKISGNNLVGSIDLNDFEMSLKWSNIGNLHMDLIQPVVQTLVETTLLPNANSYFRKGFPLPIKHGFMFQNAELISSNSRIMVCSDVLWTEGRSPDHPQLV